MRVNRALVIAGLAAAACDPGMARSGAEVLPRFEPPMIKLPKSAQGKGYRHGSTYTSTCDKRLAKRRTRNKLAKQSRRRNRGSR